MFAIPTCRHALALCSLVFTIMLSACTESGSSIEVIPGEGASIAVKPPGFLTTRAAIDLNNLEPTVQINNNVIDLEPSNGRWVSAAPVPVPRGNDVTIMVEWRETFNDENLLLARAESTVISIDTDFTFLVEDRSYNTEGLDFDFDGDGMSNLAERKADRNPLDFDVGVIPDVTIQPVVGRTLIDGRIDSSDTYWQKATYEDSNGDTLFIDNMIRDDNAPPADDSFLDYQWAAIHDEEFLTIFIFGKRPNTTSRLISGGSSNDLFFNDDSVEIYFDGNLSQRRDDFDAVDDMLINIPLARGPGPIYAENKSSEPDTRIFRGASVKDEVLFDAQDPAIVEFATCHCVGAERSTWEIRIDLKAAKIPVGPTFGFEVQINRNDDGGERDSKWAWAKDARLPNESNNDSDVTWRFPTHMGTMRLAPFP